MHELVYRNKYFQVADRGAAICLFTNIRSWACVEMRFGVARSKEYQGTCQIPHIQSSYYPDLV